MSQDRNEANKEKSNLALNLVLGFIFSGMSVYVSPYIDPLIVIITNSSKEQVCDHL